MAKQGNHIFEKLENFKAVGAIIDETFLVNCSYLESSKGLSL